LLTFFTKKVRGGLIRESMKLSGCMIVKDEEETIGRAINSLIGVVDELIVVDTGSKDNTPQIAISMGAEVYSIPWEDDFALARNFALSKASGDWILVLDADEELSAESREKVRDLLKSSTACMYYVKLVNFLTDDQNKEDASEAYIVRIFPRSPDIKYYKRIHEEVFSTQNLPRIYSDIVIYHWGYIETSKDRNKKTQRNISLLKKALAEDPNNPFFHYNLGVSLFVAEEYQKAQEQFFLAQELCKDLTQGAYLPSCYSLSAAIANRQNDYTLGKLLASKALKLSPTFSEAHYNIAKSYKGLKELAKAKEHFLLAIKYSSVPNLSMQDKGCGGWKAYCELGIIEYEQGNYGKALDFYYEALKLNPNSTLLINIAHCWKRLEALDEALYYFFEAHKIEPLRLDIIVDIIQLRLNMGQSSQLLSWVMELLEKEEYQKFPYLYWVAGRILRWQEKWKEAIKLFTSAINLEPAEHFYYTERAYCYWQLGFTLKASKDIAKAYSLAPSIVGSYPVSYLFLRGSEII